MSYEERKRVVAIVAEEAIGKPILAGAAELNVDLVLDMCRFCADLGCRAVSITGPYYYKLTQESTATFLPAPRPSRLECLEAQSSFHPPPHCR